MYWIHFWNTRRMLKACSWMGVLACGRGWVGGGGERHSWSLNCRSSVVSEPQAWEFVSEILRPPPPLRLEYRIFRLSPAAEKSFWDSFGGELFFVVAVKIAETVLWFFCFDHRNNYYYFDFSLLNLFPCKISILD